MVKWLEMQEVAGSNSIIFISQKQAGIFLKLL